LRIEPAPTSEEVAAIMAALAVTPGSREEPEENVNLFAGR